MKIQRTKKSIRRIGVVYGPPWTTPTFPDSKPKTRVVAFDWSTKPVDPTPKRPTDAEAVPSPPESAPRGCTVPPLPGTYERWSPLDELDLPRCRRCDGPIVWAQVVSDTADPKNHRWVPLDPDYMPHGCGGPNAGRTFTIEPDSEVITDAA